MKVAERKNITLYDRDNEIVSKEVVKVKAINGTKFNLSEFIRYCLRNKDIMEDYRKTPNYINER